MPTLEIEAIEALKRALAEPEPWTPDDINFVGVHLMLSEEDAYLVASVKELKNALHEISLCSQNPMSSKEECGRIARSAIQKAGVNV